MRFELNARTCPAREGELRAIQSTIETNARRLARGIHRELTGLDAGEREEFVKAAVRSVSRTFAKWNLEIVHVLAMERELRFSGIASHLEGISSRTLARKLLALQRDGIVAKGLDSRAAPYRLTPEGYRLAQLVTPVVVFSNQRIQPSA